MYFIYIYKALITESFSLLSNKKKKKIKRLVILGKTTAKVRLQLFDYKHTLNIPRLMEVISRGKYGPAQEMANHQVDVRICTGN